MSICIPHLYTCLPIYIRRVYFVGLGRGRGSWNRRNARRKAANRGRPRTSRESTAQDEGAAQTATRSGPPPPARPPRPHDENRRGGRRRAGRRPALEAEPVPYEQRVADVDVMDLMVQGRDSARLALWTRRESGRGGLYGSWSLDGVLLSSIPFSFFPFFFLVRVGLSCLTAKHPLLRLLVLRYACRATSSCLLVTVGQRAASSGQHHAPWPRQPETTYILMPRASTLLSWWSTHDDTCRVAAKAAHTITLLSRDAEMPPLKPS